MNGGSRDIQCFYSGCMCYFENDLYHNHNNVVVCVTKPIGMSDSVCSEDADSKIRGSTEARKFVLRLSRHHKQKSKVFEIYQVGIKLA